MQICPKCKTYSYVETLVCSECGHHLLQPMAQKPSKNIVIGVGVGISVVVIAFLLFATNVIDLKQEQFDLISKPSPKNDVAPLETTQNSKNTLIEYALSKINNDRNAAGVPPVELSDNKAAQILADQILAMGNPSSLLQNGEKPYMTYSKLGGTGYVQQNIATAFCETNCNTNTFSEIENLQFLMTFEDEEYDWQRLVNILDKHHTHVSIGISYDNDVIVLVQNFENNYIDFTKPITQDEKHVSMLGTLTLGTLSRIDVYYDSLPSESTYEEHKDNIFYDYGELVAIIEDPKKKQSQADSLNVVSIDTNIWPKSGSRLLVDFDLDTIANDSGVYTIHVWLEENGEQFPVTSHSIFIQ